MIGAARVAAEEKAEAIVRQRPARRTVGGLVTESEAIVDLLDHLMADSPLVRPLAARLFDLGNLILKTPSADARDLADKVDFCLSRSIRR
jgi:hypothetical protein